MPAPASILKLCETFASHRDHYRSGNYNEAQLRKEFLDPAFQLRRYAWSAKMPLSILSDFEEFAIYSRDAILKGSFDKYADSNKKKKGTASSSSAFARTAAPRTTGNSAASPTAP